MNIEAKENPGRCLGCRFETGELKRIDLLIGHGWFCGLCCSIGNYGSERQELRAIAYVGNAIIAEIRKGRK